MNRSNHNKYYKSCHKSHKGWSGFINDRKSQPEMSSKLIDFIASQQNSNKTVLKRMDAREFHVILFRVI